MVVMNGMDLGIWVGHWDGGFGGLWTLHSIACVLDDLGMTQQHPFLEMLACSHECYFFVSTDTNYNVICLHRH